MSNNKHNKGVDEFRQTLAELIRLNDERGSKHLTSNPASRPLLPQHQPVNTRPETQQNRPTMPGHATGIPHPAAPPQYRPLTSRAPMPTRPPVGRQETLERRMSSAIEQSSHNSNDDSGMTAQAGLFAGALLVACCVTFGLVYYLVSDDSVTAASSHFQAPTTAQATLNSPSPEVSNNTTSGNQTGSADAKALSDIANGNWNIEPSDVSKKVRTEGVASIRQQAAGLEPPGAMATRQELFESFQSYLQETGRAPVSNNPHQEALFNSFVRWNVEVANAN